MAYMSTSPSPGLRAAWIGGSLARHRCGYGDSRAGRDRLTIKAITRPTLPSNIVHIALGGCLRAPPVCYGVTADTGGHIAYLLAAARAQSICGAVAQITLVTRRFDDQILGEIHSRSFERVCAKVGIARFATPDHRYLEKEALAAELPAFAERFVAWLERSPRLPSVIHAHFADAAAVALVARERLGIPFVYTPHALGKDKARRCNGQGMSARIAAEHRAIETADAVIVSTRDEAEQQVGAYGVDGAEHRVHVVAPGVPILAAGARVMPPLAFAETRRPIVLAIARPTRRKNLVAVAQAFAGSRLRDRANLVILAGQHEASAFGAEERDVLASLRDILETPALSGCVALPSRHSSADVRDLYSLAAGSGGVFVSPALHEPFGLTLLEAGAAGLPVVATAHGGAADIVRLVGHGQTVDPHDRDAIAASCLGIIDDEHLHKRLSAAGTRCAEVFSWERYGQRSIEIYAAVAEAATARNAVAA